ncbi:MAG: glycosyltransferase [Candidatus Coatesbacteria bacterium]|nr:MAG: glycosyltransferase [Candidatus Coatesbacteria bacterium]
MSGKRLLLVAHNFPPLGSGGVHRPVKFARYLRDLGWEVDVLTVKDIRYHAYDPSRGEELAGVRVYRAGSAEPLRLRWLAGWRPPTPAEAPANFAEVERRCREEEAAPAASRAGRLYGAVSRHLFLPDEQIGWVPLATAKALRLNARRPYDIVLTTSPPESCHLVGLKFKIATGRPWVADFRDLWSTHHLRRGLFVGNRLLHGALEKWVRRAADGLVANTEAMARDFEAGGRRKSRVLTLPNGFDPADFGEPWPKARPDDFVVVHNGSFRGGRRARALLEGFAEARRRDPAFAARAKLYLMGINRADDLALLGEWGLEEAVFAAGYLSHREALRACGGADLLVLVMSASEGPALVPGKLYEYLGLGRPLLAAVPAGEARDVVEAATRGAAVVPPEDAEAIAQALGEKFERWRAGDLKYETVPAVVGTYNRIKQVERLSAFLAAVP